MVPFYDEYRTLKLPLTLLERVVELTADEFERRLPRPAERPRDVLHGGAAGVEKDPREEGVVRAGHIVLEHARGERRAEPRHEAHEVARGIDDRGVRPVDDPAHAACAIDE